MGVEEFCGFSFDMFVCEFADVGGLWLLVMGLWVGFVDADVEIFFANFKFLTILLVDTF